MAIIKKFVWLIVLLLCLQVIKTVLDKLNFTWSFFLTSILVAIQWLLVLLFIFYTICMLLFRRYFAQRGRQRFIVISFFVLIGLCEGLFAWWLHHPAQIPKFMMTTFEYYYYHYDLKIIQYDRDLATYNPRLYYTLRPGYTGKFENKEFSTAVSANSMGLRDDDSSLINPSVICLGDSYAMGWGVEQKESFAELLAQLSGRKVLNAGISSYGTARELILLKQLDTTALTHIVIQYCSNDYSENKLYKEKDYVLPITPPAVYDTLVKRQYYVRRYFPGKYFLLISQAWIKERINKLVPVFKIEYRQQLKTDEALHAQLFVELLSHAAIDYKKVRVVVCALGDNRAFGPEFLRQVKMLADQQPNIFHNNLRVADVLDTLEDADWLIMDGHLKPSGHRKAAEKIWEAIQEP